MFGIDAPEMPTLGKAEPRQYDVQQGYGTTTAAEIARLRASQTGLAGREKALGMLGKMEGAATGKDSAERIATNLKMAQAAKSASGAYATGDPLQQRAAMYAQGAGQAQAGGEGAVAQAAEAQKAQQAYIQAAQTQRAADVQRQLGYEQAAQAEMGLGLKAKWEAAQAQMDFEKERLRRAGIDLGLYSGAEELAANRNAAMMGLVGGLFSGGSQMLGGMGKSGGGGGGYYSGGVGSDQAGGGSGF